MCQRVDNWRFGKRINPGVNSNIMKFTMNQFWDQAQKLETIADGQRLRGQVCDIIPMNVNVR